MVRLLLPGSDGCAVIAAAAVKAAAHARASGPLECEGVVGPHACGADERGRGGGSRGNGSGFGELCTLVGAPDAHADADQLAAAAALAEVVVVVVPEPPQRCGGFDGVVGPRRGEFFIARDS